MALIIEYPTSVYETPLYTQLEQEEIIRELLNVANRKIIQRRNSVVQAKLLRLQRQPKDVISTG